VKVYLRNDELNYAPIVEAEVLNPLRTQSINLAFIVDTGFQGGVLLPLKAYLMLQLHLMEEGKAVGKLASGAEAELRVSRAAVKLDCWEVECKAYTTVGVRRPLLGREVLKETGLLYEPPLKLQLLKLFTQ